jgi:hypothetical protein
MAAFLSFPFDLSELGDDLRHWRTLMILFSQSTSVNFTKITITPRGSGETRHAPPPLAS